jgi:hypothetical protein
MATVVPRWVAVVAIVGTVVIVGLAQVPTNDRSAGQLSADTVPNMYSRPSSPPFGARWAPPTWGDGVMGSPDGWTLGYVESDYDEDSVHVKTDTLERVEPGAFRAWVRHHIIGDCS